MTDMVYGKAYGAAWFPCMWLRDACSRSWLKNAGSACPISNHEVSDLVAGVDPMIWCPYNSNWYRRCSLVGSSSFFVQVSRSNGSGRINLYSIYLFCRPKSTIKRTSVLLTLSCFNLMLKYGSFVSPLDKGKFARPKFQIFQVYFRKHKNTCSTVLQHKRRLQAFKPEAVLVILIRHKIEQHRRIHGLKVDNQKVNAWIYWIKFQHSSIRNIRNLIT